MAYVNDGSMSYMIDYFELNVVYDLFKKTNCKLQNINEKELKQNILILEKKLNKNNIFIQSSRFPKCTNYIINYIKQKINWVAHTGKKGLLINNKKNNKFNNPSDIIIGYGNNNIIGISLKSLNNNSPYTLKHSSISNFDQNINLFYKNEFKKELILLEKKYNIKHINKQNERKKYFKEIKINDKEKYNIIREQGLKLTKKVLENVFVWFNNLTLLQKRNFIHKLLTNNKTSLDCLQIICRDNNINHKYDIIDSKKLNKAKKIEFHKTKKGNLSLLCIVDNKKIFRLRFSFESTKFASNMTFYIQIEK